MSTRAAKAYTPPPFGYAPTLSSYFTLLRLLYIYASAGSSHAPKSRSTSVSYGQKQCGCTVPNCGQYQHKQYAMHCTELACGTSKKMVLFVDDLNMPAKVLPYLPTRCPVLSSGFISMILRDAQYWHSGSLTEAICCYHAMCTVIR
eukprot:610093-Rhodomonas_salina.2